MLKHKILDDAFPQSDQPNIKQHEVVYAIIQDNDISVYTDLTGRFPYRSSRGNEYLLVGYHYDANGILAQPLRNREAQKITLAWETLNQRFCVSGIQPTVYNMDNEYTAESFKSHADYHILAQHIYSKHCAHHIFDKSCKTLRMDDLINGKDGRLRWIPAMSNEWGRLAQGNDAGITATDTVDFISRMCQSIKKLHIPILHVTIAH